MWIATKRDIEDVVLREKVLPLLGPTQDRQEVYRHVGNLLTRYIVLCNNLAELFDQTLQVQHRAVIEKLLKSSSCRLLELQREMRKIEMSEFIHLDGVLIELKVTPQNIEFLRPFYFPRKRNSEYQQIVDGFSKPSRELVLPKTEAPKGLDKYRKILTKEEIHAKQLQDKLIAAVDLIKSHEKAQQARVKYLNLQLCPRQHEVEFPSSKSSRYEFNHRSDQTPLFKVKRSNYKSDVNIKPKVNLAKFTYYEPPTYRINRLGQKVIAVKKETENLNQVTIVDESNSKESASVQEKAQEEEKVKTELIEIQIKEQKSAATTIQRFYRQYLLKKALKRRNIKKMELCGMIEKHEDYDKPNQKVIDEERQSKRRERKNEFDERFIKAIEDEKARILKFRSESIMEDISDDIRQWFREFYDATQDFHRYPEEFEGGTIMVLRGETKTHEEFLTEKNKTSAQKVKEKQEKLKLKKKAKEMKKKQAELDKKTEAARRKQEKESGPTWNFTKNSKHFDELEKSFLDYKNEWQFIDETNDRAEFAIWDWVTIDAYADVHVELRRIVDDFMRIELEMLRVALAADKQTRYKRAKPKKPKKEKKQKLVVDVAEGRSLDECFEELKSLKIIRKYPKGSMDNFIGDQSYAAYEMRLMNKSCVPHYGDIKNNFRTMMLGMGSLDLPKVRSLCIAGPPKCGKKLLIEALCTEMNAVMFDLSANIVSSIQNLPKVLDLVMEMARKLQPTVIYIDGAHKPFIRKISEAEKLENPRKLGWFLFRRVVKKLSNEDAIMLMGTTNQPWNCNITQLKKCFEKIITFPPTLDYGTAMMTWKCGIERNKIYDFDVSPLAQLTRSFAIGDILDFIECHIDLRRRMKLPLRPLTCQELFHGLMNGPHAKKPLDEMTITAFNDFGIRTDPYFRDRNETMARIKEQHSQKKSGTLKRK